MADYTSAPIEERLVKSAMAWLGAQSPIVAALTLLERDNDGPITPTTETPKKLRLVVTAADEGRAVNYAPIRNIRLALTIRGNAKTDAGEAEGMHAAGALIERLLDDSNAKDALDSPPLGVRAMKALRRPGAGFSRAGMLRMQRYEMECACVAFERTEIQGVTNAQKLALEAPFHTVVSVTDSFQISGEFAAATNSSGFWLRRADDNAGRPTYLRSDGAEIYWDGSQWNLAKGDGNLWSTDDVEFPWLTTTWQNQDGSAAFAFTNPITQYLAGVDPSDEASWLFL